MYSRETRETRVTEDDEGFDLHLAIIPRSSGIRHSSRTMHSKHRI